MTVPEQAVEANHYRYDKLRRTLIPAHPGYYWALWLKAANGTHEAHEVSWPAHSWEIVQVNDNNVEDPADDEYLSVSVPGVRETQWREYFKWGPFVGPIAAAYGSYPAVLPLVGVERQQIEHAIDHFEPPFIAELANDRETWIADNMRHEIFMMVRALPKPQSGVEREDVARAFEEAREFIRNLWRNKALREREHYDLIALIDTAERLSLPAQSGSGVREDVARCEICDWPLAASADQGCVPGNCSFRPAEGSDEHRRIQARRAALAAKHTGQPVEGMTRVLDLVDELAGAEDAVAEDVGTGPRTPLVILRELVQVAEQARVLSPAPASPQPREGEK